MNGSKRLKVAILQPALPKYRIPVFTELGKRFDLAVFFGSENNLENTDTADFETTSITEKKYRLPTGRVVLWSSSQITVAGNSTWDVIVFPWNIGYASLVPALLRAKWNGIPTILWGHGYSKSAGKFRSWARNMVTNLASAVLFYDPLSCSGFAKQTSKTNCFVAANTLDPTAINQQICDWKQGSRLSDFQNEKRIDGRPILLFVSRFDAKNQLDCLIRALPEVRKQHDNILAVLVGGGPVEPELRRLVKELDCQDNVLFTGPIYAEAELAPWFLSAQMFCYPSNIGLSLIHAFHYGLPVVLGDDLTQCGPEAYAFEPEVNGVAFEYGNFESMGKTILELLNSPKRMKELAAGAEKTSSVVTTLKKFIDGYSNAIQFAASSQMRHV